MPEPIFAGAAVSRGRVFFVSSDARLRDRTEDARSRRPAARSTSRRSRARARRRCVQVSPTELVLKPGPDGEAARAAVRRARAASCARSRRRRGRSQGLKGTVEPTARSRRRPIRSSRPARSRRRSARSSGEARARVVASAAVDRDVRRRTPTAPCRPAGSTPPPASSRSTTLDGQKVLQKAPDDTIFKRVRAFIGPVDWSNYTVRGRRARRRRSGGRWRDIGITAQRYSLVLYGNSQQLKIEPWEPETQRTVDGAVRVEGRHLVSPEAARREHCRTARCGRAARRGRPASAEPAAVDDREDRSDRQPQGRAGLLRRRGVRRVSRQPQDRRQTNDHETTSHASRIVRSVCCLARCACVAARADAVAPSDPGTGDWPMWGGTPDRNMVSNMKGLPTEWDVKTKKNVKWVADLGSQSYGNPVVAGGMVFVGTNNEALRDPKQPGDRGVLMAFREVDRRVPVAADAREARVGPRQRLAVPGRRLVAARRRQPRSTTRATAAWCGASTSTASATARTTARSPTRSSPARTTPT